MRICNIFAKYPKDSSTCKSWGCLAVTLLEEFCMSDYIENCISRPNTECIIIGYRFSKSKAARFNVCDRQSSKSWRYVKSPSLLSLDVRKNFVAQRTDYARNNASVIESHFKAINTSQTDDVSSEEGLHDHKSKVRLVSGKLGRRNGYYGGSQWFGGWAKTGAV